MSRYDGADSYTYPDSDVLRNKAELREQAALDAFEADISAVRLLELTQHSIPGNFDLEHLKAIHRHLFQDVYAWAGELRTVDISKDGSRFGNCGMIEAYLAGQLSKIAHEGFWVDRPFPEFITRLAYFMGEINAAHPFREGNGRVQRAFCALLAERAGYFLDFDGVSRDEMYGVMIASFHGDNAPLETLLARICIPFEPA